MRMWNGHRWWVAVALLALPLAAWGEEAQGPIDLKQLSCGGFRKLPEDIQPLVAAWVHGYTRGTTSNAWLLDVARVRSFLADLDAACDATPGASFRYKLLEVSKTRQAAEKAANKKK